MEILLLHGYWPSLLKGAGVTVSVSILSGFVAIALGLIGAMMKLSRSAVARGVGNTYTTIMRGIPDLVIMLLLYFGAQVALNTIVIDWFGGSYIDVSPFAAGVLTIGFVYGAYVTETFRGAILAVSRGQLEAAEAYGMSRAQVAFHILVPQMIRHALPGLNNNWLVLMKATALVSVIGLNDMVFLAGQAGKAAREPFLFYLAVAFIYLVFTSVSSPLLQRAEKWEIKPFVRCARVVDGIAALLRNDILRIVLTQGARATGYALAGAVVAGGAYFLIFGFSYSVVGETFHLYGKGLVTTLWLTVASLVIGLILAIPLAVGRTSPNPWINGPIYAYTYFFRGTPLIVQLYLIYYGLSQIAAVRESIFWPLIDTAPKCALIAFVLNTTAYTAEIIRGAISQTPKGEVEAAKACGMSRFTIIRRILLPSALRRALPSYGNEMIFMLHGTAVASVVTVEDVLGIARIVNSRYYTPYEAFVTAALFYLALTFTIVLLVRFLEARFLRHLRPREHTTRAAEPATA